MSAGDGELVRFTGLRRPLGRTKPSGTTVGGDGALMAEGFTSGSGGGIAAVLMHNGVDVVLRRCRRHERDIWFVFKGFLLLLCNIYFF